MDALVPKEMAEKAEGIGVTKAHLPADQMFVLAVLAGAFISLGGTFFLTTMAGASALPFGLGRLFGGLSFCLGLILVVVGGAELFTGNNLIAMAWASGRVTTRELLRNWAIVYAGNFGGAVATAVLVFASGHYRAGGGAVGVVALNVARAKCSIGLVQALAAGVLCNALVCLAVWLCMSARSTADRVLAIVFPIAAFVAAGFEHSIANMFFVPYGWLVVRFAPVDFWTEAKVDRLDYAGVDWGSFLLHNLVPVSVGNVLGGSLLVGATYWFVFLRRRPPVPPT